MSERCIICGEEIPEGRQVCPACEKEVRTERPDIKPCPFCGTPGTMYSGALPDHRTAYRIVCENSACSVFICTVNYSTPREAAEVWNNRFNDTTNI